jgi:hypothetical protein
MCPSPYRVPAEPTDVEDVDDNGYHTDGELIFVFVILWIGSFARVAINIARHETFGTEGTLAFLIVLLVPMLLKEPLLWLLVRRRRVGRAGDRRGASCLANRHQAARHERRRLLLSP